MECTTYSCSRVHHTSLLWNAPHVAVVECTTHSCNGMHHM